MTQFFSSKYAGWGWIPGTDLIYLTDTHRKSTDMPGIILCTFQIFLFGILSFFLSIAAEVVGLLIQVKKLRLREA